MSRKVFVDKEECVGCGVCADDLPDIFRMEDDGKAIAHNSGDETEERIQEIMDACPGECIYWADE